MNFSDCIALENGNLVTKEGSPMDGLINEIEVEVKTSKTTKRAKKKISKTPNSRFFKLLFTFLSKRQFEHMLRYVPGTEEQEFEVIYIDKKSRNWEKKDIALFIAIDKQLSELFKRVRSKKKYEEEVKIRFKSNMKKCVTRHFIEDIPTEEEKKKCKTVKRYKILWKPPVAELNNSIFSSPSGSIRNYGKIKKKSCRNQNKASKKNNLQNEGKNCITHGINSPSESSHVTESVPQKQEENNITLETILQNGDGIYFFENGVTLLQGNPLNGNSVYVENGGIFESIPVSNSLHFKDNNGSFEEKNGKNSHFLCLSAEFQQDFHTEMYGELLNKNVNLDGNINVNVDQGFEDNNASEDAISINIGDTCLSDYMDLIYDLTPLREMENLELC